MPGPCLCWGLTLLGQRVGLRDLSRSLQPLLLSDSVMLCCGAPLQPALKQLFYSPPYCLLFP